MPNREEHLPGLNAAGHGRPQRGCGPAGTPSPVTVGTAYQTFNTADPRFCERIKVSTRAARPRCELSSALTTSSRSPS